MHLGSNAINNLTVCVYSFNKGDHALYLRIVAIKTKRKFKLRVIEDIMYGKLRT